MEDLLKDAAKPDRVLSDFAAEVFVWNTPVLKTRKYIFRSNY